MLSRAFVGRWQGPFARRLSPCGCNAAVIAVGRKPPAVFSTEGARAGEGVGHGPEVHGTCSAA